MRPRQTTTTIGEIPQPASRAGVGEREEMRLGEPLVVAGLGRALAGVWQAQPRRAKSERLAQKGMSLAIPLTGMWTMPARPRSTTQQDTVLPPRPAFGCDAERVGCNQQGCCLGRVAVAFARNDGSIGNLQSEIEIWNDTHAPQAAKHLGEVGIRKGFHQRLARAKDLLAVRRNYPLWVCADLTVAHAHLKICSLDQDGHTRHVPIGKNKPARWVIAREVWRIGIVDPVIAVKLYERIRECVESLGGSRKNACRLTVAVDP